MDDGRRWLGTEAFVPSSALPSPPPLLNLFFLFSHLLPEFGYRVFLALLLLLVYPLAGCPPYILLLWGL